MAYAYEFSYKKEKRFRLEKSEAEYSDSQRREYILDSPDIRVISPEIYNLFQHDHILEKCIYNAIIAIKDVLESKNFKVVDILIYMALESDYDKPDIVLKFIVKNKEYKEILKIWNKVANIPAKFLETIRDEYMNKIYVILDD